MPPDNEKTGTAPSTQEKGKPRWARIILVTLLAVLLVMAGTLAWLINDTDRVKTTLEGLVSTLTNRPLHINGDFDFTLGSVITVDASQVVWDNADWSSQPTMLTVERIQVSIDLRSLLQRPVLITNAVATNARLDFEWSPDNISNWYLANPAKPPRAEPLHPLPLLLDKASLINVELHFKHPGLTDELIVLIENARQQQDETNHLVAAIDAEFDKRKVAINGRIGPFPELVIAGAIDFDISVQGPNSKISIKGDVENLAKLRNPNLDLAFQAPEIATVLDILNLPEVTHGAADLKGSFASSKTQYTGNLKGNVGEFQMDGAFEAASLQPLQDLTAHLASQGPSAAAAGRVFGIRGLPREPYDLGIRLTDQANGIAIEEISLETAGAVVAASGLIHSFPALANMDLELKLDVENIARFNELLPGDSVPAVPLNLEASVKSNTKGDNDSLEVKARLGKSDARISALLTEDQKFTGSRIDFSADVPDSLKLGETLGLPIRKTVGITLRGAGEITAAGIKFESAQGKVGPHKYSASGELPLYSNEPALNFDAAIEGPDLAELVSIFAVTDRIPAMPYQLGGTLLFANNTLSLKPVSGNIGDNKVSADGTLQFAGSTPDIDLKLSADGTNLSSVLQTQGIEGGAAKSYAVTSLFQLSDSGITVSELDFQTQDDLLQGTITVGGNQNPGLVYFDLSGKGADLRSLLPTIPGYTPAAVPFTVLAKGNIDKQRISIPELSATLGTAKLSLAGELDLPPNLKATGVTVEASGPHLSDLGSFPSWAVPDYAFDISATVGGTTNHLEINDFVVTAGPSDLRGQFILDMEAKPNAELRLASQVLDIRPLQKRMQEEKASEQDAAARDKTEPEKDTRLIPDQQLPVDLLNALDASVQLRIDKLVSQKTDLGKVNVEGTLRNGRLDIPSFSAKTNKGQLKGELHVEPDQARTRVELKATAKNLVLAVGQLDDMLRKNHPGQDIDLHLISSGSSYRELAAGLNGYLWARGGARQIKASELRFLFGDFLTEVFTTINPFAKKDPYQTLECERFFFEVVDGVVQTSPAILLRTDKINIRSVGAINLLTEEIDFAIETSPRTGIGISAGDLVNPFIKISGSLAKPGLALNPAGTLIEGGAAVATMGITIVAKGMYKRWLSPRNPCKKLTEDARAIRTKRDPNDVPAD